jgi:hypothetical protein
MAQQVVGLGYQIVQRATRRLPRAAEPETALAKRNTAVHASTRLHALLVGRKVYDDIVEIGNRLGDRPNSVLASSVL